MSRRVLLLGLLLHAGACVVVPQSRRGRLADKIMQLDEDALETSRKFRLQADAGSRGQRAGDLERRLDATHARRDDRDVNDSRGRRLRFDLCDGGRAVIAARDAQPRGRQEQDHDGEWTTEHDDGLQEEADRAHMSGKVR